MMEITVNQQTFQVPDNCNVAELMDLVPDLPLKGLAVALNQTIVPKANWPNCLMHAGDQVMIIKATQGG
jgi:sulfur carrier protein